MADEPRAENRRLEFILDDEPFDLGVKVKVVGIGDAAGNVFDHLRRSPIKDAELILIDADSSPPWCSDVTNEKVTNETNAPSADERGPLAIDHASVEVDQVAALIDGANLILIVACLEDDTAALVSAVAALSRQIGALTIAVVATPLNCLEPRARERAERELNALENAVDGLIHVPLADYQRLIPHAETPAAIHESVEAALAQAVRAFLLPVTGQYTNILCVDAGDLRHVFWQKSKGAFAVGCGYGDDRASETILAAVGEEGLLVGGARLSEAEGVWLVIEGGDDLTLSEVNEAVALVQNWVDDDTEVVFSTFVVPEMGLEMRATILTTGHGSFGFQSPPNYHAGNDLAESFRNAEAKAKLCKRGEQRAQELIAQLLPEQAERYRERKFVETDSRLFAGARYRIHLERGGHCTDLIVDERAIATFCMTLRNHRLPPSDLSEDIFLVAPVAGG